MKNLRVPYIILAVCLLPTAPVSAGKHGGHEQQEHGREGFPVRLELVSPLRPRNRSIQFHAGWPLSFKLVIRREAPLVVPAVGLGAPSEWPEPGATSFVILRDLDDCPAAGGRIAEVSGVALCPDFLNEELWIEFTPDEDSPNTVDEQGYAALRAPMKDPARRPTVNYKDFAVHTFGPKVHDTLDGLGYGANDDLPGFVLLADTGVGKVLGDLESFDEGGVVVTGGWEPTEPLQGRNLAGFMTSVGYELNDERGRTTITTSLTIPRHLTARRYLEDQCFVPAPGEGCTEVRRVEGGPILPIDDVSVDEYDVSLRAFVVQGVAPTVVTDCNDDGRVSAADARCMGYQLLSREVRTTIRQIGRSDVCNRLPDPWGSSELASELLVDFDGNGELFMFDCPGAGTGGSLSGRPSR